MWWTGRGYQILRGDEWLLFRAGLDELWDWAEESFDNPGLFSTDIAAFDDLQPGQKLALMVGVGQALRERDEPAPDLTAPVEATVAAVYAVIRIGIETEIDLGADLESPEDATYWRRLVQAACLEVRDRDILTPVAPDPGQVEVRARPAWNPDMHFGTWTPPAIDCQDHEEWEVMVDCLAERILWDVDYEMAEDFLDKPPQVAGFKRKLMRIDPNYFTAIAPDPTEEQLGPIRAVLRELCGRPETCEPQEVDGLRDAYHDLLVGPCDPVTLEAECTCPLVEWVSTDIDGFECSYSEWSAMLRDEVLQAASHPDAAGGETVTLAPEHEAAAARAASSGQPIELINGRGIERYEGGWIVTDVHEGVLVEDGEYVWDIRRDDPESPPLKFEAPEQAILTLLRCEAFENARHERRQDALKRLGHR